MAGPRSDNDIDALYQLPLTEFTAARNALAKGAGARASEIRALTKPPVPAWAVNQVYWRHRDVYEALVVAARALRAAHAAVLGGKRADLRAASAAHEEALEAALKAAIEILQHEGQPVTPATRQAISTTLRGLPAGDPPGRLARTLQPGGFEMLSGMPIAPRATIGREAAPGAARAERKSAGREARSRRPTAGTGQPAASPKDVARARDALAAATRAVHAAEHAARREEFSAARATREAERAERSRTAARAALEAAKDALADAERDAEEAARERDRARERAATADQALAAARARADAAQREHDRLRGR